MSVRGLGEGRKAALLINECQRGVLDPSFGVLPGLPQEAERRNLVGNIRRLLAHFRERKLPVFHLPFVFRPDLADLVRNSKILAYSSRNPTMVPGRPEADYMPGLEPLPSEFVVTRTANLIAFNQTELDATLRRLGVQTLVLTGISTNVAIPGITMAAVDCAYDVVVPEDCISGSSAEAHEALIQHQLSLLATMTSADEVIEALA